MISCKRNRICLLLISLISVCYIAIWHKLWVDQYNSTREATSRTPSTDSRTVIMSHKSGSDIVDNLVTFGGDLYASDAVQHPSSVRPVDAPDSLAGKSIRVAVGLAVTSASMKNVTKTGDSYSSIQLFYVLLSSFCKTASRGYEYHIYVAYDYTDRFFITNKKGLQGHYREFLDRECAGLRVHRSIHFLECRYSGRPAWSQNDAMMDAYLDGNDYFYRVNDDSMMLSSGWTEAFIETLRSRHPANVGVVGPNHQGGNTKILTHDFVHKTHIEIFGLYYPRCYSDLYADTWISKVYPNEYTSKLSSVRMNHTQGLGKRYKTRPKPLCKKINTVTRDDKTLLARYLNHLNSSNTTYASNGTKVIAMSLYGNLARHTVGAIRNAQLAPVLFPGWRLRVYTGGPSGKAGKSSLGTPQRIIDRLDELGAQITYPDALSSSVSPIHWPYLIVDDTSVDYFIVRNSDGRLSPRDYAAVTEWVAHGASFHLLRDQAFQHYGKAAEGLWGGNGRLRSHLPSTMQDMLHAHVKSPNNKQGILEKLHHAVGSDYLIHDGFSCLNNPELCWSFRVRGGYRVGQIYDEVHRAISSTRPPRRRITIK